MIFDKRKEIEKEYSKWAEENNLSLSPSSMIAFFDVNKLLNEQEVKLFLHKQKEIENDNVQEG